jgi:conjugal transfer pilus assembly protein TraW
MWRATCEAIMLIKKRFTIILVLFLMSRVADTTSLGVVGETFSVAEVSFLSFIEQRLADLTMSGEMKDIEGNMIQEATQHITRPTPVGLSRTNVTLTHRYTPKIVLMHDIKDHFGRVLIHKGASINALLSMKHYEPHWVFLDADDSAQLRWVARVLQDTPTSKVILTGGSVSDAERLLNRDIFFDQGGRITHQLGINHVPARVSRDGDSLLIEELAIKEDGDAR